MLGTVFIANRGEIAVRIIRTLRRMGIRAVVAASIPDRHSLAVRDADASVLLPGYTASETYLNVEALIAAARAKGCDAVHPGYGFLSENPAFAEACAAAGLTFIGPPPAVLRTVGDKSAARAIALANKVPVVPGWDGEDDAEVLLREAGRIGFPVLLKARAGGGGRGMRIVNDAASLPEAVGAARREAVSAFGDGRLFLEKLVAEAHHVEVQVLADAHGNVIHLGERDCTLQRRHQKLLEETPSPVVDAGLRERLTAAALRLMRAAGYVNAGTVEFLVGPPGPDGARPFYFLEVNPRLQVEHPVTEAVTGLDLVELQVRVAAGEPLPLRQDDVSFEGHAIECRVNAEDPWNGFQPGSGRLLGGNLVPEGARLDSGYAAGDVVPQFYDSLLAKLIVHAPTRLEATEHALASLAQVSVEGPPTNLALHAAILRDPAFRAATVTTHWLEDNLPHLLAAATPPAAAVAAAALALAMQAAWPLEAGHRQGMPVFTNLASGSGPSVAASISRSPGGYIVAIEGETLRLVPGRWSPPDPLPVRVDPGGVFNVRAVKSEVDCWRHDDPGERYTFRLALPPPLPRRAHTAAEGVTAIVASLAGTVVEVRVAEGDTVEPGQLLVVLEAMKMEHRITASAEGTVKSIVVAVGDVVAEGQVLVELA